MPYHVWMMWLPQRDDDIVHRDQAVSVHATQSSSNHPVAATEEDADSTPRQKRKKQSHFSSGRKGLYDDLLNKVLPNASTHTGGTRVSLFAMLPDPLSMVNTPATSSNTGTASRPRTGAAAGNETSPVRSIMQSFSNTIDKMRHGSGWSLGDTKFSPKDHTPAHKVFDLTQDE
jgi:hypothetical protein